MKAISLFSSSGIGDLGLHANGIETVIANEIITERAELFVNNNPNTKMFNDDIWSVKDKIIDYYKDNFSEELFLILATPPCQGMSSNGMGKMLSDYRKGIRPEFDERNRLILPTIDIIEELLPKWVIFENVPNMMNTLIYNEKDELVNIIDYIFDRLGRYYVGKAEVVDAADYGVPQNRKRLITILSKDEQAKDYFRHNGTFLPNRTHSKEGNLVIKPWITVRDAISNLPPIDGKKGKTSDTKFNPLHKVPPLDEKKYFWVENTPEGETAFNNQCINPKCLFEGNMRHGATRTHDGINKANQDTPLYCEKCGELLPRPYVEDKKTNTLRLMKGYVSAYKRMKWDEPASTLTQNFQFACSDNKLHPNQNRVLSMYEGIVLQSISEYPYSFKINGRLVKDGLIRDTIGESVPPKVIDIICKKIKEISKCGE
ncbi:DNA (cytosine-5)-methyltransferase 1 [Anaerotaenia torta]|uniref:DNA cytosine methyltransferase n=1 Tax=Anaerotaenia torta TaxID=433293 RepID=UPI003D1ACF2B